MTRKLFVLLFLTSLIAQAAPQTADLAAVTREVESLRLADAARGLAVGEAALAGVPADADPLTVARLRVAIGGCLNVLARNAEARAHYEQAIAAFQAAGDDLGLATAHRARGVGYYDEGRYDEAVAAYLESLAAADRLGDPVEIAKTSANVGNVHWVREEPELARRFQTRALEAFRTAGFAPGIAGASLNLGATLYQMGDRLRDAGDEIGAAALYGEARIHTNTALETFTTLQVPRGIAHATSNLGNVARRQGRYAEALDYFRRSLAMREDIGDKLGILNSHANMAFVLYKMGRVREAERTVERVLASAGEVDAPDEIARLLDLLQEAAAERGDYERAYRLHHRAVEVGNAQRTAQAEARFAELSVQYEAKARDSEAALARVEQERVTIQRNWALSTIVLIALLLGVLWNRYRLQQRTSADLAHIAATDELTGLPNRRQLLERMAQEVSRASRSLQNFSVIIGDADDFKRINDTLGHDAGDQALRQIAAAVRSAIREHDLAGRWGGEEFLILLPETGAQGAAALADKLRERLNAIGVGQGAQAMPVRMTFGVCEWRVGMTLDDCLRRADQALYRGKQTGRDRVEIWEEPLAPSA